MELIWDSELGPLNRKARPTLLGNLESIRESLALGQSTYLEMLGQNAHSYEKIRSGEAKLRHSDLVVFCGPWE